jgi:3-deoxy-7-phosphoheptulonate synthase
MNLFRAYFHSSATVNYIRALLDSGFADLHNPRSWKLSHVHNKELAKAFDSIVERLEDSLDFLKTVGGESGTLNKAEIWTSHEVHFTKLVYSTLAVHIAYASDFQGLMLEYEEAFTRQYSHEGKKHWYNTSALV